MTREYDYYNPLASETYDSYTSAPYYQYLFTDPSGMTPQNPITSKKDALGEQLAPGSTGLYDSLPPPPKKFGITTSESFSGSSPAAGSSMITFGGNTIDFNTIILIILVAFIWFLVYRTGKLFKSMKKLKKMLNNKGAGTVTGSYDDFLEK